MNSDEYDSAFTDASSGTGSASHANFYNNSLSTEYENFIKKKANKLRRKSQGLVNKLGVVAVTDDDERDRNRQKVKSQSSMTPKVVRHKNNNNCRIYNGGSLSLLNKNCNMTSSTTNTADSSYCDTLSQDYDPMSYHQRQHSHREATYSSSESERFFLRNRHDQNENDLVIENGEIKSGVLDKIIDYLVELEEGEYKKSAIFCTLLSARIFEPPHRIFKQIFNKIFYEYSAYGIYKKETLQLTLMKLVNVLNEWTHIFPYDFRNQKMMKYYRNLTNKCLNMDISLKDVIIEITSNLLINIRNLELYESYLNKIHYEASLKLKKSVIETNILIVAQDARLLAQQLTHIELDRLKHISAEEFIQYCNLFEQQRPKSVSSSNVDGDADSNKVNVKNTSNIEAYIQWFNRLSNLVCTEIVKHLKRETRVRMINFFIDVAQECFNNGNFNSLMAIIASLNNTCVSRLKKTWMKIDRQKLEILQKHLEFNNNYSSYRQLLQTAKAQAKDSGANTVIPFFALVMKDLTSLSDGIPNKFDNGHVNFEKLWKIAKYISELLNLKISNNCSYSERNKVINYLLTTPLLTDDGCVLASYECEVPESENEKRHREKLRVKVQDSSFFYQSFD